MRGGTLFSGIAAPEVAMPWVDWRWCAEIDPFASAVLKHHYPHIRNLGDVNEIDADTVEPVDLVVFGSPCQSWSVAGKRLGLDDPRGNMALVALRLVSRIRPKWMVFENVPGLLSSDGGRDFGAFLGLLGECGYGFAFRILDAKFAGVPQRRRRVFVVGYLGDWRPPAAVLFEQESLRGDSPPRRAEGQRTSPCLEAGANRTGGTRPPGTTVDTADSLIAFDARQSDVCAYGDRAAPLDADRHTQAVAFNNAGQGWWNDAEVAAGLRDKSAGSGSKEATLVAYGGNRTSGPIDVATAVNAHGGPHGRLDFESETFVVGALQSGGTPNRHGTASINRQAVAAGHVIPVQNATRGKSQNGFGVGGESMFTLDAASQHAVAFQSSQSGMRLGDKHPTLDSNNGSRRHHGALHGMSVRRLTPKEAARLQGFADDWLDIVYRGKPAADGNKYRALGNSMAVPVVRWIGHHIRLFEEVTAQPSAKGRAA